MLKALVWKQFYELFRTYFINPKTGKKRKAGSIVGLFILFGILMLVLMGSFFAMGAGLADILSVPGMEWFFFAVLGILSVLLGTFGSVFNTYASLYIAKDNEQMLALPIPPSKLLGSRLISVYLLSLLYSSLVWIPTTLWGILGTHSVSVLIASLILTLIIPVFVSAVTCALGWVVALISTKLKRKSIFVAILSVLFFIVYYMFCFRMNDILSYMMDRTAEAAGIVKVWGVLFYSMGMAASGNLLHFLIFTAISFGLAIMAFVILSRSFVKITTMDSSVSTKKPEKEKELTVKEGSVQSALLKKEFKRLTSSATYMMNGAFGALIMVFLPIILFIKRSTVLPLLSEFAVEMPEMIQALPLMLIVVYTMTTGMDMIAAPSISLEGKSLWVLKTLPVPAKDILEAKARVQQMVNIYPTAVSLFLVGFLLGLEPDLIVFSMFWVFLYINVTSYIGLIVGLNNPNFNWVNETTVIKSGINIFLVMILDWVLALAVPALYFLLRKHLNMQSFLLVGIAILFALNVALRRYVQTKGAEKFERL